MSGGFNKRRFGPERESYAKSERAADPVFEREVNEDLRAAADLGEWIDLEFIIGFRSRKLAFDIYRPISNLRQKHRSAEAIIVSLAVGISGGFLAQKSSSWTGKQSSPATIGATARMTNPYCVASNERSTPEPVVIAGSRFQTVQAIAEAALAVMPAPDLPVASFNGFVGELEELNPVLSESAPVDTTRLKHLASRTVVMNLPLGCFGPSETK